MTAEHKENARDGVHFIYRTYRIAPDLKPYIPIIGVGFTLLLSTWEFPKTSREGARNTKVPLSVEDVARLDYLTRHAHKSATEVISAALLRAKASNVRPRVWGKSATSSGL
jgi:hypothetical protein